MGNPEVRLIAKLAVVFSVLFVLFLVGNYWYLLWSTKQTLSEHLSKNITHITSDLHYKNGVWNVVPYMQDTTTPLDKPLYVFTTDGYVIERMNPVEGFFDTAQYEYASSFPQPTSITSAVSTSWRIYSQKVVRDNIEVATILTAYYDPTDEAVEVIDNKITSAANYINSNLEIANGQLRANNIEPRNIPYHVYYTVVDRYNKVLAEDGAPPGFIDRSYVASELHRTKPYEMTLHDGNPYLILSKKITDANHSTIGLIIMAEPMKDAYEIFNRQKFFAVGSGSLVLLGAILFLIYAFRHDLKQKSKLMNPSCIMFDLDKSAILLDTVPIPIEYGSKQYDLCKTLFSRPQKRWEHDELFDKNELNIDEHSIRLFYDAMLRINKKIRELIGNSLILYEHRTYRINPEFLSKVQKSL